MFGTILKNLRKQHKMTQSELAKKLKISASTIGMYEQNRRAPDNQTLAELANVFGVSVDYILGRTTTPTIKNQTVSPSLLEDMKKNKGLTQQQNHIELLLELSQRDSVAALLKQIEHLPDTEILRIVNIIKALEYGEHIPGAVVEDIELD